MVSKSACVSASESACVLASESACKSVVRLVSDSACESGSGFAAPAALRLHCSRPLAWTPARVAAWCHWLSSLLPSARRYWRYDPETGRIQGQSERDMRACHEDERATAGTAARAGWNSRDHLLPGISCNMSDRPHDENKTEEAILYTRILCSRRVLWVRENEQVELRTISRHDEAVGTVSTLCRRGRASPACDQTRPDQTRPTSSCAIQGRFLILDVLPRYFSDCGLQNCKTAKPNIQPCWSMFAKRFLAAIISRQQLFNCPATVFQ